MTEQSASQTEPSMDDILASIRRIMDDEEAKSSETAGQAESVAQVATAAAVAVQPAARPAEAAEPRAQLDEDAYPDPDEETIFPERSGLLWRRVAGRALTDDDARDDPLDLTDELDAAAGDLDTTDLDKVLDAAAASEPGSMDDTPEPSMRGAESARWHPRDLPPDDDDTDTEEFFAAFAQPESAQAAETEALITAAAESGEARFSGNSADVLPLTTLAEPVPADDDEDDVLDLTRVVGDPDTLERVADAMTGAAAETPEITSETEAPAAAVDETPAFETIAPTAAVASYSDFAPSSTAGDSTVDDDEDDELLLDEMLETVAEEASSEAVPEPDAFTEAPEEAEHGYETVLQSTLNPTTGDDAHERALDKRFEHESGGFEDEAPEIAGDYTASLGTAAAAASLYGGTAKDRHETDELDTVGGLVRDALKYRGTAAETDDAPLISGEAEESASRALVALNRYDTTPRRVYGQLRITDDADSPTVERVVREELRPMLREWLNENLPTVVETMVKQEVDRISARSRRFVRGSD